MANAVFPTCVGMNRSGFFCGSDSFSVPHMRGDEPDSMLTNVAIGYVFPTCVGMNRDARRYHLAHDGVPHMRGDEPHR